MSYSWNDYLATVNEWAVVYFSDYASTVQGIDYKKPKQNKHRLEIVQVQNIVAKELLASTYLQQPELVYWEY